MPYNIDISFLSLISDLLFKDIAARDGADDQTAANWDLRQGSWQIVAVAVLLGSR